MAKHPKPTKSILNTRGKPADARRRRFVAEFLIDYNATQAAIRAGYSRKTAGQQGARLLKNEQIEAAIDAGRRAALQRAGVKLDDLVREASAIAFSSMGDYYRVTGDGDPAIDLRNLTDAQKAALAEVSVDDYVEGRGEDARQVKKVKIKLHDKLAAIVKLGQHFGGFGSTVTLQGPGGGPIAMVVGNLDLGSLDERGRDAVRAYLEGGATEPGDQDGDTEGAG